MHLHGMENLTFRSFVPTGDILRNQTYAHLEGEYYACYSYSSKRWQVKPVLKLIKQKKQRKKNKNKQTKNSENLNKDFLKL